MDMDSDTPGKLALLGAVIFLVGVVAYCFPWI